MANFELPEQVLQTYWGHEAFRPSQKEIIDSILEGRDTLAILPTGGGKSICFQVPALMMEGCCLVISPLIALMEDQVQRLQAMGIPAKAIMSGMTKQETEDVLEHCEKGNLKFLYVSPERLETRSFVEHIVDLPINLIAVDESHCISQWGYDFRPAYLKIAAIREPLSQIPLIALTASATGKVKEDILDKLKMKATRVFMNSFSRENLVYQSTSCDEKITVMLRLIDKIKGSGIIYCKTRRRTKEISDLLQQHGISSDFYHAGLDQETRKEKQAAWLHGSVRIMVCTNAFGMGIDKPDVRLVIHADVPDCMENYYQEAGRAGRDGQTAHAVLLYRKDELEALRSLPDQKFPSLSTIRKVYHAIANHHQIPTGTGAGTCHDLDLDEFISNFRLPLMEVVNSLQVLKQEQVIQYIDKLFMPTTVQFICSRYELEEAEEFYPELEPLIKSLLRTYAGILDFPIRISEKQLAWKNKISLEELNRNLTQLKKMGLIAFEPRKETPQVCYLQDRIKADELEIDHAAYNMRKANYAARIEKMIAYASEKSCRSVMIGRYFGDLAIKDCGKCDVCSEKKHDKTKNTVPDKILALLREEPRTFHELILCLNVSETMLQQAVQFLQSEDKLTINKENKLAIK
jgi:ATP-dependent DNA helicase RecQ